MSTPPAESETARSETEDVSLEDELHAEVAFGGTARGQAANAVLQALSRAARSFLIYEPTNEAIRIFLDNLRRTSNAFIESYGELQLEIRPFELVHNGEVVYLDRDRERSLAFRLYRDGVRKLTLRPGLDWQELLKLLEVMSIRFVGVRQTEDDLVVLLWKAAFSNIAFEAVEGFVADSDDEGGAAQTAGTGAVIHISAPPDFDLPLPVRKRIAPVRYRVVPQAAIDELLAEDDTQGVAGLALHLAEELLAALADPHETLTFVDLASHLNETREFVFSEGHMAASLQLAYAAASADTRDPKSEVACLEFLQSFVSAHALRRFLHSVSQDASDAPHELYAMLKAIPGDHLKTLVEVLSTEQGEASRRVARRLIEMYVGDRGDEVVSYIQSASDHLACELLRVLRHTDLDRTLAAAKGLVHRSDHNVQLAVLSAIEAMPNGPDPVRLLVQLGLSGAEDVRPKALAILAARRSTDAFAPLLTKLKREASARLSNAEAETLGQTLIAIDTNYALTAFREWCRPRGLLAGVLPGHARLQRAAVAGLANMPGEEAETLIRAVSDKAGSELQEFCTQVMVRRRRLLRGGRA